MTFLKNLNFFQLFNSVKDFDEILNTVFEPQSYSSHKGLKECVEETSSPTEKIRTLSGLQHLFISLSRFFPPPMPPAAVFVRISGDDADPDGDGPYRPHPSRSRGKRNPG